MAMRVIEFVFSSFWTFLGTWVLLGCMATGLAEIVRAARK